MAKKIIGYIKIQVPARKANPSPPIGPALGQRGVNIMGFCKEFNAKTASMEPGMPIPVIITVYQDKSFTFIVKTPPATYFLKKFSNITKGSSSTGKDFVGEIGLDKVKEIANIKMPDLNANTVEAAVEIIKGSARSIGIKVKD